MLLRHLTFASFLLAVATPVHALDALVEEASASAGIAPFSFLNEGDVLTLGSDGVVVLGSPASCVRERITGGKVTVGAEQSSVAGGAVARDLLPCGTTAVLSSAERQESGATAWRADPTGVLGTPLQIGSRAPFFLFSEEAGRVVIERTDIPARPIRLSRVKDRLDLAERDIELAPGAAYTVSVGDRCLNLEIDPNAGAEAGPAFLRAIPF